MITFILLFVFAVIGIAWTIVAYSAKRRKSAQFGESLAEQQEVHHPPRAVPPAE